MYTVSIYNQKSGQWRTTSETTLAACVALTLGLATYWTVSKTIGCNQHVVFADTNNMGLVGCTYIANGKTLYRHAKRALICRWVSRIACKTLLTIDDRTLLRHILRLSDKSFLDQIQRFDRMVAQFNNSTWML